jgi:hypothetical protein
VGGDHAGVAGQLLVDPQPAAHDVDRRVEPVHAGQQGHQGVDRRIAAFKVGLLVGQNDLALARRVALGEVVWDHHARPQHADHGRAGLPGRRRARTEPGQASQAKLATRRPARAPPDRPDVDRRTAAAVAPAKVSPAAGSTAGRESAPSSPAPAAA